MTTSQCTVAETATVGIAHAVDSTPPKLGADSTIRAGTIIYDDVVTGENLQTGHHALIREYTTIGHDVVVGTHAVIDGHADIGNSVSLQTGAYVPQETTLADRVFLGPSACLLNDPYPVRAEDEPLAGPTLEADVSVGGNATILPGVSIGENSVVAAGAVVTEDIPREKLAIGVPATVCDLPPVMEGGNDL
jgi:acetyltransferase-like isoleucine patch superfamily enzyme